MERRIQRRRTQTVPSKEVEFMVLQYSCLDNGVVQALGKSCLVWNWLVAVGNTSCVALKLTVDTHILGRPEISLMLGDQSIFPPPGGKEKAKLKEDLKWQCPFRGQIAGISDVHRFELRPEHSEGDNWYPATIMRQREDGLFEVYAQLPGAGTSKEVHFPAVRQELLRDAERKLPVKPEMRSLNLIVPCKDPKNSTLTVDSQSSSTLITHFFARRTPPVSKDASGSLQDAKYEPARISFSVSQTQSLVKCTVGHRVLEHFVSGEVRACSQELSTQKASWTVQVGPYALHTIEMERRYLMSQVFTLVVDGDILVEATAEDLESPSGTWDCSFRLLGEKFFDWEVYEQTPAGVTLGTKGTVSKRHAYSHECNVSFPIDGSVDMSDARLMIDGREFSELPGFREATPDTPLALAAEALRGCYNLEVPVRYNRNASPVAAIISNLGIAPALEMMGCGAALSNGLFCCGAQCGQQLLPDSVVMPARIDSSSSGGLMVPKLIYPQLDHYNAEEEDNTPQRHAPRLVVEEEKPSPMESRTPDLGPESGAKKETAEHGELPGPQEKGAGHGGKTAKPPKCCAVQ